jgi:hypothetical protein
VESYKAQMVSYIINIRINICKWKYLVNRWVTKSCGPITTKHLWRQRVVELGLAIFLNIVISIRNKLDRLRFNIWISQFNSKSYCALHCLNLFVIIIILSTNPISLFVFKHAFAKNSIYFVKCYSTSPL